MIENLVLLNRLIKLKEDIFASLFLGKIANYGVEIYLPCNIILYTEDSQAVRAGLKHGGREVILNEFKLAEPPFC